MAKKERLTSEDDELLANLGVEVKAKKQTTYTPTEERVIVGFEEIQKYVEKQNRLPNHGEQNDIFERIYAVRLEKIQANKEHLELLKQFDHQNILTPITKSIPDTIAKLDDDELLEQLGVKSERNSITNLQHVKTRAEKRAAEEFANRTVCEDFDTYDPLFQKTKKEIENGFRETIRFRKDAGFTKTIIKEKLFVIVRGQMAYIASKGEIIQAPNGEEDARLRVIYENGTENDLLQRSLIRAMYKDETSRFVTSPGLGPLFSDEMESSDLESGTIYVLRSNSDHPEIIKNREVIHKIGVTGNDLKKRLVNAKSDPTFLMAEVEVVATYKLANIKRHKLENLIQTFFKNANLDIEIIDRFGKPVKPKEWFLVPIFIINELVEKIKENTADDYYYDIKSASLKKY